MEKVSDINPSAVLSIQFILKLQVQIWLTLPFGEDHPECADLRLLCWVEFRGWHFAVLRVLKCSCLQIQGISWSIRWLKSKMLSGSARGTYSTFLAGSGVWPVCVGQKHIHTCSSFCNCPIWFRLCSVLVPGFQAQCELHYTTSLIPLSFTMC